MNIKSCFLRWGIPLLLLAAFLAAVFALNRVDKVALVNREGQTFEKGVVVDILQDNLHARRHPGGRTAGSGPDDHRRPEGQEIETTSSLRLSLRRPLHRGHAGGGHAERGGGHHRHQRLFPGSGVGDLRLRRSLSAGAVPGRRKAGRSRARLAWCSPSSAFYLSICPWSTAVGLPSGVAVLVLCRHHAGHDVPHRRPHPENRGGRRRHGGGRGDCRTGGHPVQPGHRHHGLERVGHREPAHPGQHQRDSGGRPAVLRPADLRPGGDDGCGHVHRQRHGGNPGPEPRTSPAGRCSGPACGWAGT